MRTLALLLLVHCSNDTFVYGSDGSTSDATADDAGEDQAVSADAGGEATVDATACPFDHTDMSPCLPCSLGVCCLPPEAGATCAIPTLCGGASIGCVRPSDCVDSVCCLSGTDDHACPHTFSKASTSCAFSCSGARACVYDSDCTGGKTCKAATVEGTDVQLGLCL